MRILAAIALWGVLCFGDAPQPPECTKEIQGKLWPEEANTDRALAHRLFQSGELQMCSLVQGKYTIYWKYRWQYVSLNARDPEKAKPSRTAR
jgi:hypothetical protein